MSKRKKERVRERKRKEEIEKEVQLKSRKKIVSLTGNRKQAFGMK